ncbi:plasminogen-binding N-terminal domain-containing protein [Arcobacter sp. FWKO B]|uniref:plasminogen-binding N-terminal domain-containing protein n=1 Tax=Arcobacter sp. FWKO B TaxID=2593672 RepID=UPI0018A687D6|nr:plasminogen-binding N-terminal domain-containing protein [Arcobacter sp. FWKO B]QOG12994.1 hypothetical protein FWKOB_09975 [Arcobacter sp. FWKO B]
MILRLIISICLMLSFAVANLNQQTTTVTNVSKNNATIGIGNLTIGQTGVILHNFDESKSIIIADFEVVSTTISSSSIIFKKPIYENEVAIPTPNISVKNGDTAILNHMYNTSILIVPNIESFRVVTKNFPKQNFLHSDLFASYLKTNNQPVPKRENFSAFCKKHNIGTIFFVVDENIYIVDSQTFTILEEYKIKIDNNTNSFMSPFYTNVEDIKLGLFSFGESSFKDYNSYYSKLLGL